MQAPTFTLDLDWKLLREQKQWLLKAMQCDLGVGILHLIDSIQDQAVLQGVSELEVFGKDFGHEA